MIFALKIAASVFFFALIQVLLLVGASRIAGVVDGRWQRWFKEEQSVRKDDEPHQ
jgi:hypothetical protein